MLSREIHVWSRVENHIVAGHGPRPRCMAKKWGSGPIGGPDRTLSASATQTLELAAGYVHVGLTSESRSSRKAMPLPKGLGSEGLGQKQVPCMFSPTVPAAPPWPGAPQPTATNHGSADARCKMLGFHQVELVSTKKSKRRPSLPSSSTLSGGVSDMAQTVFSPHTHISLYLVRF